MNIHQNPILCYQKFQITDHALNQSDACIFPNICKNADQPGNFNPNINEFKTFLSSLVRLNKQMEDYLVAYKECYDFCERLKIQSKLEEVKEQINTFHEILGNEEYMRMLKKKLTKVKKKRKYIANRKENRIINNEIDKIRRSKFESNFDNLIILKQVEQDIKCKKAIDVNVKKLELNAINKDTKIIKSKIDLLESLIKLRIIRSEKNTEITVFNEEDTFEEDIQIILNELLSRLTEMTTKRDSIIQKIKELDSISNKSDTHNAFEAEYYIKNALFGTDKSNEDWFYDSTFNCLNNFIEVRLQWDKYIVPQSDTEGSFLPIAWVLPEAPSHESWEKYLL